MCKLRLFCLIMISFLSVGCSSPTPYVEPTENEPRAQVILTAKGYENIKSQFPDVSFFVDKGGIALSHIFTGRLRNQIEKNTLPHHFDFPVPEGMDVVNETYLPAGTVSLSTAVFFNSNGGFYVRRLLGNLVSLKPNGNYIILIENKRGIKFSPDSVLSMFEVHKLPSGEYEYIPQEVKQAMETGSRIR